MKLIKTGVPGLDEIFKGGILENSSILVTGAPGTGKTILALQFIYEGAKMNEPGLYIATEEPIESIRNCAKNLGFDLEKYEKKGLINFIAQPILTKKIVSIVTPLAMIKKKKIKRVVLDSLTLFKYTHVAGEMDYRKEVLSFLESMRELGVTLLATAEIPTANIDLLEHKPEDFLFTGLIILLKIRKTSYYERCITVAKMRGQDHLINIFPFTIEEGGIKVFPKQMPFSLVEKKK